MIDAKWVKSEPTRNGDNSKREASKRLFVLGWMQLYFTRTVSETSLHPSVENQTTLDGGRCFRKSANDPKYAKTRSLGALRAPTSSLWPFGPALGPSGLLDFVLRALQALRPCDPRNGAMIG